MCLLCSLSPLSSIPSLLPPSSLPPSLLLSLLSLLSLTSSTLFPSCSSILTLFRLSIHGGSNGGLLVCAVANQKPEMFQCVVSQVGYAHRSIFYVSSVTCRTERHIFLFPFLQCFGHAEIPQVYYWLCLVFAVSVSLCACLVLAINS